MATNTTRPVSTTSDAPTANRRMEIAGWVVTGLVSIFLLFDAVSHLAMPQGVKDASYDLGLTDGDILAMGLILLGCLALYLFPRTAILGSVLLTGYLGGAATAQIVNETEFAAGALLPVVFGALVWLGLWLRSNTVRSIMPFTQR
ncbi:DoxX family protein [Williamsia sp.]|uniref:DoxX family protein n=1 Tax=Williamsia sp. TaxID=1872085 RepID=UPI002F95C8EF